MEKEEKEEKTESIELADICIPISIVNMILNQLYYKTWSMCVLWQHSQSLQIQFLVLLWLVYAAVLLFHVYSSPHKKKNWGFFQHLPFSSCFEVMLSEVQVEVLFTWSLRTILLLVFHLTMKEMQFSCEKHFFFSSFKLNNRANAHITFTCHAAYAGCLG